MPDKRTTQRRYLLYYMRVYDSATRSQVGNLLDITPKGMMLVCEKPFPVGQTIQLRLELSREVAEKPFMDFSAHSKWCKPDVDPHMYNVGFEILDIAPEDAGIINRINQEFGFRENKPKA
jgi:hypothetical protein